MAEEQKRSIQTETGAGNPDSPEDSSRKTSETSEEGGKTVSILSANTTALAYLGDAVYEVFIREYVLKDGGVHVDRLNKKAIQFVRADSQAAIVREMIENGFLTDEEEHLVKRGRNHTNTSRPRGSSPMQYKWATGFEALIGYLYQAGRRDRLEEVVSRAVEIGGRQQKERRGSGK